ncbi:hypothetical protein [Inquilinus limosus]|uniref:Secreted protein n=1 Tax=Inquilinus limosus MP06 TaxID=1398085 RepID=A0A0A0D547_9PROT|nr:hypothetical protein [Inquilinus limosus]KGM32923.1 hypothetical protein P409_18620 [Inquilinus limosus MP06]
MLKVLRGFGAALAGLAIAAAPASGASYNQIRVDRQVQTGNTVDITVPCDVPGSVILGGGFNSNPGVGMIQYNSGAVGVGTVTIPVVVIYRSQPENNAWRILGYANAAATVSAFAICGTS